MRIILRSLNNNNTIRKRINPHPQSSKARLYKTPDRYRTLRYYYVFTLTTRVVVFVGYSRVGYPDTVNCILLLSYLLFNFIKRYSFLFIAIYCIPTYTYLPTIVYVQPCVFDDAELLYYRVDSIVLYNIWHILSIP